MCNEGKKNDKERGKNLDWSSHGSRNRGIPTPMKGTAEEEVKKLAENTVRCGALWMCHTSLSIRLDE
jgi:hypothetical protein